MNKRSLLRQTFGLVLIVVLLTGCSGAPIEPTALPVLPTDPPTPIPPTFTPKPVPTATPIPMGIITGMVFDKGGKPLVNIYDDETLIVALVCLSDTTDIECIQNNSWGNRMTSVLASICEADDTSSSCLLHIGQGAAYIEPDGSYVIDGVPPGKYGIMFLAKLPGLELSSYNTVGPELVEAGETITYDVATGMLR